MSERSFYLVTYDVADDKRRTKLARHLEAIGDRVQDSVFELYLTAAELEKLLKQVRRLIKPAEDSVRIYFICSDCRGKVRTEGLGRLTPAPGVRIV